MNHNFNDCPVFCKSFTSALKPIGGDSTKWPRMRLFWSFQSLGISRGTTSSVSTACCVCFSWNWIYSWSSSLTSLTIGRLSIIIFLLLISDWRDMRSLSKYLNTRIIISQTSPGVVDDYYIYLNNVIYNTTIRADQGIRELKLTSDVTRCGRRLSASLRWIEYWY